MNRDLSKWTIVEVGKFVGEKDGCNESVKCVCVYEPENILLSPCSFFLCVTNSIWSQRPSCPFLSGTFTCVVFWLLHHYPHDILFLGGEEECKNLPLGPLVSSEIHTSRNRCELRFCNGSCYFCLRSMIGDLSTRGINVIIRQRWLFFQNSSIGQKSLSFFDIVLIIVRFTGSDSDFTTDYIYSRLSCDCHWYTHRLIFLSETSCCLNIRTYASFHQLQRSLLCVERNQPTSAISLFHPFWCKLITNFSLKFCFSVL